MKTHEFNQRKLQADLANQSQPEDENYMVFGERKKCINPTLLNQRRERLGYNPKYNSPFYQCQTQRPRY